MIINQNIEVAYAVMDANGCPRKEYDLSPSGFIPKAHTGWSPSKIIIPIDPVTALRCRLATAEELGLSGAFLATLSLLNK